MLSGDNGILKRAGDAKTESEKSQEQEIVALAYNSALAKKVGNGDSTQVTSEDMNTELTNQGATADGSNPIIVTFTTSQRQYTINNGIIKFAGIKNNEDTETGSVTIELSIAGTKVNATTPPNPDSSIFEHVDGTTIDTGYVIRDKNNGNEFVWVPVEANQKITLNVTSPEDITSIKLYDPLGKEISLGTVSGKNYNNTNITPTINGGYKAEVMTASGTCSKTLVVRSLYAKDTFLDDYYENIYTEEYCLSDEALYKYSGAPNFISKSELYNAYGITDDASCIQWIREQALSVNYSDGEITYSNSINTNGGFYIARYEAGASIARTSSDCINNNNIDGTIAISGVPTSKIGQIPYNNISYEIAKQLSESIYTNSSFTSTLLTGAGFDRTLGWIVNTNNNLAQITEDSTSWGNYYNANFTVLSTAKYSTDNGNSYTQISGSYTKQESSNIILTTGATNTRNVLNNIFDLAGNVNEWTSESRENEKVCRGGCSVYNGAIKTVSIREAESSGNFCSENIGFRIALYL